MATKRPISAATTAPSCPVFTRILDAARRHFISMGVNRITMDDLAGELGMSKKTLYAHFPGKEALIAHLMERKIAEVREGMHAIADDLDAPFADRVHRMATFIVRQTSEISPVFLRDLERHHPALFARIEAVRAEILPEVWGKVLASGAEQGLVRAELDPRFLSEMMLTTLQQMLRPAVLDRLELPPHEIIDRMLTILFNGILTPAGRKAYEKGPSR